MLLALFTSLTFVSASSAADYDYNDAPDAPDDNGGGFWSAAAAAAAAAASASNGNAAAVDPHFSRHVSRLRSTMFYVCQGSCLCGTVNNRGKVIYCYGDLVPRHGELFSGEGGDGT